MYQTICHSCGHKDTAYAHRLNKSLCLALNKLVTFYEETRRACKSSELETRLELTYNQISNFQKLKYFGLVANYDNSWQPTEKGIQFIHGDIRVRRSVITFRGQVIDAFHPAYREDTYVSIKDIDETLYKRKPEYGTEKKMQLSIIE